MGDRRRRCSCRRVAVAAMVMIMVAAGGIGAFLITLPGVGDAEARVALRLGGQTNADRPIPSSSRIALAIVAVEDERFYDHFGIDLVGVGRAAWSDVSGGGLQGGSTITEQLAKNLYADGAHSIETKLDTMGLALKLEDRDSKRQILEMYLNSIYFGDGCWGVVCASETYFRKSPVQLDWAEASMLAGLPQAPSAYDPIAAFGRTCARQRQVLAALVRLHVLTPQAASAAYAELTTLRG